MFHRQVASCRDDIGSFLRLSCESMHSEEVSFREGSPLALRLFDDCNEPFDKVVLRRLVNSGSDRRR
ncbi:CLUMA_CG000251, isoform A [Clunio marinus]|uniref:CLUMA_CG000251, isoform A n=1 Tax=Clunio marinus TaxID=568069 RepID=A0A1J1HEC5_9DIPT|nr:CLUMA_CG000251, isoform A [Clunio marinus]